ncbi:T9SS type A sorting domain-containing protein [Fodinibius sp. AD559]|uniref:T9SS type A sorting domain-containing protein n=1 Tax=Fodinibius sp. AD559 TaxID=3424179 RepID=UPI004046EC38
MKLIFRPFFLCIIVFLVSVGTAQSQDRVQGKTDLHQKIERAYLQGDLSLDQKVLYKFFPTEAKGKLPDAENVNYDQPLKCGTPATSDFHRHKSELSSSTVNQIESLLSNPTLQASETYQSPDGYFTIHYETSGPHAVPSEDSDNDGVPDYVEGVATAADSSYRHEVQRLNYTDPVVDNSDPYPIFIENTNPYYGFTDIGSRRNLNSDTFIAIHNDFENFPPNDDPEGDQIGAIKVTVAHEFKHAVQYEANDWQGETESWLEMDATLMEEVVYDNVNDYYNYIIWESSIFNSPSGGFYPGSYEHITWALFFEEKYGSQFWVDVWKVIKDNPFITMVDAMTQQLGGAKSFDENYIESQLWHYASGDNSAQGFGFEERQHYPTPPTSTSGNIFTQDFSIPREPSSLSLPGAFAANYFEVPLQSDLAGNISLETTSNVQNSGVGLIAYFNNGTAAPLLYPLADQQASVKTTSFSWQNISKLGLVLTNSSTSSSDENTIYLALGGNNFENMLSHNYPNPFKQSTKIRFTLDKKTDVQLKVYNTSGRLIKTLINEELTAGLYEPTFDGSNLASGVYIYQLITNQQQIVKKMTLIK